MYFWSSLDHDPPKEATWEEYSTFERNFHRFFTFSEIDHKEQCAVYTILQRVPTYGGIDRDFIPTNFLSSFSINSHKGRLHLSISIFNIFFSIFFHSLFLNIVTNYYVLQEKNL